MEGRRIKRSVIYVTYGIAIALLLGSIYLVESSNEKASFAEEDTPLTYVSKTIFDDTVSVVSEVPTMTKPFNDDKVKVVKSYYDYTKESKDQENAIIYYENTYMQSSGISYSSEQAFSVLAVLDGTVTSVTQDDLLGNIVEIKHDDDIVTLYESLKDVTVKVGDVVKQGATIGTSGNSNLQKDIQNQLYFEILIKKQNVNPENCFGKTLEELKG